MINSYVTNNRVKFYKCVNKQGTVSREAYNILKKIFQRKENAMIFVNGEEDLLALPVFVFAQEKSVVLYGQPLEGIVIVKVDNKLKKKAQDLLDSIGIS